MIDGANKIICTSFLTLDLFSNLMIDEHLNLYKIADFEF